MYAFDNESRDDLWAKDAGDEGTQITPMERYENVYTDDDDRQRRVSSRSRGKDRDYDQDSGAGSSHNGHTNMVILLTYMLTNTQQSLC